MYLSSLSWPRQREMLLMTRWLLQPQQDGSTGQGHTTSPAWCGRLAHANHPGQYPASGPFQAASPCRAGFEWLYLNLPNGYQHYPKSVQSPDQANQPGLIHDDIRERSHLAIIDQYFSMSFRFPKPPQPGVIQLTSYFDLIPILRIQTDGLWHIRSLREGHARPGMPSRFISVLTYSSTALKLFPVCDIGLALAVLIVSASIETRQMEAKEN